MHCKKVHTIFLVFSLYHRVRRFSYNIWQSNLLENDVKNSGLVSIFRLKRTFPLT